MVFLALSRSALAIAALLLFGPSYSEAAEGEVVAYEWPTAGWRVSTPEEQGMDSAALAALVDFGASRGLNSLLVARHGMIVVEAFYAPFRSGLKHRTRSVTKSFIGTLVGIGSRKGAWIVWIDLSWSSFRIGRSPIWTSARGLSRFSISWT